MRAHRRRDGLRGDGSGTAVQRSRRSPCGRAPRLRVAKMMRVRWFADTDEATLLSEVLAATIAPRGGDREHALVEAVGVIPTGETPGVHSFTMPQVVHTGLFA